MTACLDAAVTSRAYVVIILVKPTSNIYMIPMKGIAILMKEIIIPMKGIVPCHIVCLLLVWHVVCHFDRPTKKLEATSWAWFSAMRRCREAQIDSQKKEYIQRLNKSSDMFNEPPMS